MITFFSSPLWFCWKYLGYSYNNNSVRWSNRLFFLFQRWLFYSVTKLAGLSYGATPTVAFKLSISVFNALCTQLWTVPLCYIVANLTQFIVGGRYLCEVCTLIQSSWSWSDNFFPNFQVSVLECIMCELICNKKNYKFRIQRIFILSLKWYDRWFEAASFIQCQR